MKTVRSWVAAVSCCCWMAPATITVAADNEPVAYPSDPQLAAVEIKLRENIEACVNGSNRAPSSCENIERPRLERSYPFRGTRAYVTKIYVPMQSLELLRVRRELLKQSRIARSERDFWVDAPRPEGELTKEMLGVELQLVDRELEKRRVKGDRDLGRMAKDLRKIFD